MMRRRNERGTAALEFAIILPILLLVILSLIDFGRYFYVRINITNASIEVANAVTRGLILDTDSSQAKTTKILAVINNVSPDVASFAQLDPSAQIDSTPLPTPCPNSSNQTTVTLTTTFQSISPLKVFFDKVSGTSTLRCLR